VAAPIVYSGKTTVNLGEDAAGRQPERTEEFRQKDSTMEPLTKGTLFSCSTARDLLEVKQSTEI